MNYKEVKVSSEAGSYAFGIECADNATKEDVIEESIRMHKFKHETDKYNVSYIVDITKEEYIGLKRKD